MSKGQLISKCLLAVFNFFQKTNKNMSHSSKNKFIRSFLEEFMTWQFAFEINWPLTALFSWLWFYYALKRASKKTADTHHPTSNHNNQIWIRNLSVPDLPRTFIIDVTSIWRWPFCECWTGCCVLYFCIVFYTKNNFLQINNSILFIVSIFS